MGRIGAPFGVRGWLKIHPLTADASALLDYSRWWLRRGADWHECEVVEGRLQAGDAIVARLAGCEDREAAAGLRGSDIAVRRSELPAARPGEYYWADLFGLTVVNAESQVLGKVVEILQTGSNDVLVVRDGRERLIPFLEGVIRGVDAGAGTLQVDWSADY